MVEYVKDQGGLQSMHRSLQLNRNGLKFEMVIKHTPVNYSADGWPLRMLSSRVALGRGEKGFLIQWRRRQEICNKNTQGSKAKDGLMLSSKCRCKRRLKVAVVVELGVRCRFQFSFCYRCQAITATHPSSIIHLLSSITHPLASWTPQTRRSTHR